ncbi:putative B3 domain-containing protein [Panicum miliaceum]|uniref:B3 domain-containing protein n=1 Tax=Panicum miliaceum TaxID=4540 RepID=A0A3L6Q9D7_PANMI|nr:putative B3 domain-containing protein [Panicum miliaceum]
MASSGNHGAAKAKDLRVLLPFTCDSLRIPDKLAEEVGASLDDSVEVLVVGPRNKVRRVEVGWDGDGAFLGCGWPELADACGVEGGWFLVVRHRGRGLLTIKAFDRSYCLRELGIPSQQGQAIMSGKDTMGRPQFISILSPDSMEKMLIPAKFVHHYFLKEPRENSAIVLGPRGKVSSIKLEMKRSGIFFAGGWSQFLSSHPITEDNNLLIRYEGESAFTVKVFDPEGLLIQSSQHNFEIQNVPTLPGFSEGQKKPNGCMDYSSKASKTMSCVYNIGPPAWVKKKINANTIENHLALPASFCEAIGLLEACTITLKTSMRSSSYWQVVIHPYKNSSHRVMSGWRRFCRDNGIKVGDVCTIRVLEPKLWYVFIAGP